MAKPKCFYCDGLVFELHTAEILDCAQPHCFIQCAKCGMPVGVIESKNVGRLIEEDGVRAADFRAAVHRRLEAIESQLKGIREALVPLK